MKNIGISRELNRSTRLVRDGTDERTKRTGSTAETKYTRDTGNSWTWVKVSGVENHSRNTISNKVRNIKIKQGQGPKSHYKVPFRGKS